MRKFAELLRFTLVSPETVALLIPFLGPVYFPDFVELFRKRIELDLMFSLAASGLAIGMLSLSYSQGAEILAPSGAKKVILDWPDYRGLKARIIVSWLWCVLGASSAIIALYMVSTNRHALWGTSLLLGGILSAATATALVSVARISSREIFRE